MFAFNLLIATYVFLLSISQLIRLKFNKYLTLILAPIPLIEIQSKIIYHFQVYYFLQFFVLQVPHVI